MRNGGFHRTRGLYLEPAPTRPTHKPNAPLSNATPVHLIHSASRKPHKKRISPLRGKKLHFTNYARGSKQRTTFRKRGFGLRSSTRERLRRFMCIRKTFASFRFSSPPLLGSQTPNVATLQRSDSASLRFGGFVSLLFASAFLYMHKPP